MMFAEIIIVSLLAGSITTGSASNSMRVLESNTNGHNTLKFYGRNVSFPNLEGERETPRSRIERVEQDISDIETFYNVEVSKTRASLLRAYFEEEVTQLEAEPFDIYGQSDKVDYLLLKGYLTRRLRQLDLDAKRNDQMAPLVPFSDAIIQLVENRQNVEPFVAQDVAKSVDDAQKLVAQVESDVLAGKIDVDRFSGYRAANTIEALREHLDEWYAFYMDYDPLFTWWVAQPYDEITKSFDTLAPAIREQIVGIQPGDNDAIVGEPIGSEGLLSDLEAEVIPYSPEELLEIGESEYAWSENEMKKASQELGYGDNWHDALEYVKGLYVAPGDQPVLVHNLSEEAVSYVRKNDMVTIPQVAEAYWRTYMLSPEAQKTSPFFLGGTYIQVSFPTSNMTHVEKMMSLRANNIHFSRATVFHEMNPGHHLQYYAKARYNQHRNMFTTPFWVEGWAVYWETIFYDRGDFFLSPEDRIGTMFWRMHRCIRIIFSIRFHLGQITPQEAIDMLVERVGHERSTAEGEVRRSFNGAYTPLYQAGYLLGALQLRAMRKELVEQGGWTEKEFHNRFLRENEMPIEMLRALLENRSLTADYKAEWRFYEGNSGNGTVA